MKVGGIQCKKCGDAIWSRHVHDFRPCKCGSVAVDGGREYLRICGNPEDYEVVDIETATGKVVPPKKKATKPKKKTK